MLKTPDKQRIKREITSAAVCSPVKKIARDLSKQHSAGQIINPTTGTNLGHEGWARSKQRQNPTTSTSLTPNATRAINQRVLKKSSSVCGKMMYHSEDRKLKKLNSDSKTNQDSRQDKITRSASRRTPVSRTRNIIGNSVAVSPDYPRKQAFKITPLKGKKKRDDTCGREDINMLRPKKKLAIFPELESNDNDSAVTTDEEVKPEKGRKPTNKKVNKLTAEVQPVIVATNLEVLDGKEDKAETPCQHQINDTTFIVEKPCQRLNEKSLRLKSNQCAGDFSVQVAVRVRPFSQR